MSKLFATKAKPTLGNAVITLNQSIKNGAGALSAKATKGLLSLESLDEAAITDVQNTATTASGFVTKALDGILNLSEEAYSEKEPGSHIRMNQARASKAAATMIAMAYGDPQGYHKEAMRQVQAQTGKNVKVVNATTSLMYGGMGIASEDYQSPMMNLSQESFDENNLRNHIGFSTVFAAMTARQSDFSEAFFPTYVVSADNIGVDVKARRNMILHYKAHDGKGNYWDLEKRHILDAYRDSSILQNEATEIVPAITDEVKDHFVDAAIVPHRKVVVERTEVLTGALKFDMEHDMLRLSQHEGLLHDNIIDMTDSIDAHARLDLIYLSFGGGKAVAFDVRRQSRSGFTKTIEGDSREMGLQFTTNDLLIHGDLKAADGSEIAGLAGLKAAGIKLRARMMVTGIMNVEYGNLSLSASGFKIVAAFDKDNNPLALTEDSVADIIDALKVKYEAFTFHGRRTNTNRRNRGLLVDVTEYAERYTVPLSSPISAIAPMAEDRAGKDLEAIINACNIRTNNNAVTLLQRYEAELEATAEVPFFDYTTTSVCGIGRLLVKPFFERVRLDLAAATNSVSSKDRVADISGVIISTMRELAYRMVRDSNYQPALDAETQGRGEKPHLVIGTDIVTQQFMMVTGDTRTMSIGMDHTVVASPDLRVQNKIYMTFVRPNTDEPDALSFGSHIYVPELSSVVPVTRNNTSQRETMVQMRNLQITNLPILAVIELENLTDVTRDRTGLNVITTTAQPKPGEGGTGGNGGETGNGGSGTGNGGQNPGTGG